MGQKILIIDDNKGDIKLIEDLFKAKDFDYQILWADNGMDGLEIAKKENPEIVLLDMRMPGFDGYAVCQKLKSLGIKNMNVIMMTGSVDAAAEAKTKDCGADGYCLKLPESIFSEMLRCSQQKIKMKTVGKMHILLVEDNQGDQVLMQEVFRETGMDVELSILESADQIVHFSEKLRPQLIFMDVMMSGVTGGDAAKLLKYNAHTKDIPVVFLTGIFGLVDELDHNKGINIDGQNYPALAKPVDAQRLMAIVKKYV